MPDGQRAGQRATTENPPKCISEYAQKRLHISALSLHPWYLDTVCVVVSMLAS